MDAPLGSTSLAATVDVIIHLVKTQDGTRYLESERRVGDALPRTVLTQDETGWFHLGPSLSQYQEDTLANAILAFLLEHGEVERDEILAGVEGRTESKARTLYRLLREGRVERKGTGKKGDPFRYGVKIPVPKSDTYSGDKGTTIAQSRATTGRILVPGKNPQWGQEFLGALKLPPPGAGGG